MLYSFLKEFDNQFIIISSTSSPPSCGFPSVAKTSNTPSPNSITDIS